MELSSLLACLLETQLKLAIHFLMLVKQQQSVLREIFSKNYQHMKGKNMELKIARINNYTEFINFSTRFRSPRGATK
jgi:hypothetical protein